MRSRMLLQNLLLGIFFLVSASAHAALPQFVESQRWIPDFIGAQQKLNDKVEAKGFLPLNDIDVPRHMWPDRSPTIDLKVYLVPLERVEFLDSSDGLMQNEWIVKKGRKKFVRFLVHSLSQEYYDLEGFEKYEVADHLHATPLASHRSMVAWNPSARPTQAIFPKVSLDRVVAGVRRIMSRGQLERAYAVSQLLKEADTAEMKRLGIHLIDEPLNVILKTSQPGGRDSGFAIRQTVNLATGESLLPMFSIYAKRGNDPTLLEVFSKQLDILPRDFAFERIIKPMIDHLFHFAFREGVIPDAHEQNVTVLLRKGHWTNQFYYLDLAGFYLNPQARAKAGKSVKPTIGNVDYENLLVERANIIDKIETYLLRSNFYALASALADANNSEIDVEREWVRDRAMNVLEGSVMALTGTKARSLRSMKVAITKYLDDYTVPADIEREQKQKRAAINQARRNRRESNRQRKSQSGAASIICANAMN